MAWTDSRLHQHPSPIMARYLHRPDGEDAVYQDHHHTFYSPFGYGVPSMPAAMTGYSSHLQPTWQTEPANMGFLGFLQPWVTDGGGYVVGDSSDWQASSMEAWSPEQGHGPAVNFQPVNAHSFTANADGADQLWHVFPKVEEDDEAHGVVGWQAACSAAVDEPRLPTSELALDMADLSPQGGYKMEPHEYSPVQQALGKRRRDATPSVQGRRASSESSSQAAGAAARQSPPKVRRGDHAVFKTQSSNSKRGHYASDVWEGHKAAIRTLYLDEGKPLREVIKVMEKEHSFPATQRMYKARFKQWGFVKNNTEKVVSQILRTKFERDAAGKLSHFTRNGKDVNLQNYLQRKGLTEYDLVDFGHPVNRANAQDSGPPCSSSSSSSSSGSHVRCRTPPATATATSIPPDLRLPDRLRFQDTLVTAFKRAFVVWRHEEDTAAAAASAFTWRVTDFPHLAKLMDAARLTRDGDGAGGVAALNGAFRAMMGSYLGSMDATASFYFFFHRQSRAWQEDARIALAVWKFLAAYASGAHHHPLLHAFRLMYEVMQKEGVAGLRELLTASAGTVADELERAFGREHWLKDLIWHRCFPDKSRLRHLELIRHLRDKGAPATRFVRRLY